MKKFISLNTFQAIATLVGGIIGAGILGIPYALAGSGFLTGFVTLLIVGIMSMFLNLFVGEIILRVKQPHQLPGYAGYFLGKKAKHIFAVVMILGAFGALIAYIIGVGQSMSALFGGNSVYWGIGFSIFSSYLVFRGVQVIKSFELFFLSLALFIILVISVLSFGKIDFNNFNESFNYTKLFLPYGVALFAYGGMASIQPVREILKGREKFLKKIIIISSIIPIIVYVLFAFIVVGVTGQNTTEVATVGLGNVVGDLILLLGNLFAIFAMGTSSIIMGLVLKNTFQYDYKISQLKSWAITCFIPVLIYLAGVNGFVSVLSLVGAVGGGVQGIMVVIMYWKTNGKGNRKPEYDIAQHYIIGSFLILMFIFGILMIL